MPPWRPGVLGPQDVRDEELTMEAGWSARAAGEYAARVRGATARVLALEARAGATAAGPEAARAALAAWAGVRAGPPGQPAGPEFRRGSGLGPETGRGSDVGAALGELAQVAGWLLFDAERHRAAHRFCRLSLSLARHCGDRATEQLTLATLSMQAAHLGRPDTALRLADAALEQPRLPARVAAVFHLRRARAHALGGRRGAALAAVDLARGLVGEGPSPRDPAWAWWVDEDEVAGHLGLTHAGLGEWHRAVDALTAATRGEPGTTGFRALFDAELLTAGVRAGAWRDATALAARMAQGAGGIGSARAAALAGRAARSAVAAAHVPGALRDAARHLQTTLPPPYGGGTSGSSPTGPEGSVPTCGTTRAEHRCERHTGCW
ncbi:DNA-binding protein [Streptomyces sp. WMMC897]|uniref:DNA-binding protein n=1 Tax=Streptomyces sp. WMMC897 TaxID=3014782 RepID=UPI0022B6534E|nr:DNA-binding protein [Streptomyces sp. WMMC897]MCZ7415729.1 DNA-binding protein [Streptomyces sp. WMMC897]